MKYKLLIVSVLSFATCFFSCDEQKYSQGKIMYENFCANCHMDNGEGLAGLIPPLANADYLQEHGADLACVIKYGQKGKLMVNGIEYDQEMPGEKRFSDVEIANILNYINHAWGNDFGYIPVPDVTKALNACEPEF